LLLLLLLLLQEASPEALLFANDVLLRLEGSSSAQSLTLPQGTTLASAGTSSSKPSAFAAQAAALRGAAAAGAAMPQVHGLLLEQLDLVPSRGGIEAAGLRFLQMQVGWRFLQEGNRQGVTWLSARG
jgi:hypothetical protein